MRSCRISSATHLSDLRNKSFQTNLVDFAEGLSGNVGNAFISLIFDALGFLGWVPRSSWIIQRNPLGSPYIRVGSHGEFPWVSGGSLGGPFASCDLTGAPCRTFLHINCVSRTGSALYREYRFLYIWVNRPPKSDASFFKIFESERLRPWKQRVCFDE